jgi:hypothetical protein
MKKRGIQMGKKPEKRISNTIYRLIHGGVEGPKINFFFTLFTKMNFFLNYIFLKNKSCSL